MGTATMLAAFATSPPADIGTAQAKSLGLSSMRVQVPNPPIDSPVM
jgi:hypothetical protein